MTVYCTTFSQKTSFILLFETNSPFEVVFITISIWWEIRFLFHHYVTWTDWSFKWWSWSSNWFSWLQWEGKNDISTSCPRSPTPLCHSIGTFLQLINGRNLVSLLSTRLTIPFDSQRLSKQQWRVRIIMSQGRHGKKTFSFLYFFDEILIASRLFNDEDRTG